MCEQPLPVRPARGAGPAGLGGPSSRSSCSAGCASRAIGELPYLLTLRRTRLLLVPPAAAEGRARDGHSPTRSADLLEAWLPGQRWFAGKGRPFSVVGLTAARHPRPSGPGAATSGWSGCATPTTARRRRYQVPLVRRPHPADQVAHVLVGETPDPDYGGQSWWYDALHDKEVTGAWLAGIDAGRAGRRRCRFTPRPGRRPACRWTRPACRSPTSRATPRWSSTTTAILKVFRRVEPGRNPDIEVHEALSRLDGGARHVARLLGYVSGSAGPRRGEHDRPTWPCCRSSSAPPRDGWELAKISVRDLYAEGDLHADEVGGDFAGEAHRLGVATAEVHARPGPGAAHRRARPAGAGRGWRRRCAAGSTRRWPRCPSCAEHATGLRAAFDALAGYDGPACRCSGCTATTTSARCCAPRTGWVVLDFEGEPAKPLAERTRAGLAAAGRGRDAALIRLRCAPPAHRPPVRATPELPRGRVGASATGTRSATATPTPAGRTRGRTACCCGRTRRTRRSTRRCTRRGTGRRWLPIPLASLARLTEGARS